jgi:lysine-specific demethylase 8
MELREVDRAAHDRFRPLLWLSRPAVVVGGAARWPALLEWTPRLLASRLAGHKVPVRAQSGSPRRFFDEKRQGEIRTGLCPFDQFIEAIEEVGDWHLSPGDDEPPEEAYFLSEPLAQVAPQLVGDIAVPGWFKEEPDAHLWIGHAGISSGCHFDIYPNCNVQIYGEKRFILFPPSERRRLYWHPRGGHCAVDLDDPDYLRHPRLRRARGYQCVLRPGESLYIPTGWFHHVVHLSPVTIAVNFWWPASRFDPFLVPNVRESAVYKLVRRWRTERTS